MQRLIGICSPLRKTGNKALPARHEPPSGAGVFAEIRHRLVASAGTLILLVASASLESHAADPPVRVGGATYLGDAPTVVAHQRGLFTANGIDAEIDYAVSGKRNLERLRAGELEFALMALTPLVLDRLDDPTPGGDDDPVILASVMHATHLNEVLVVADGRIDGPADFEGRVVGLTRNTSAEFAWWLFTRYHDLDPNAIEVIDRPAGELADALTSGAIDAAILWSPWEARLEAQGDRKLHGFASAEVYSAKWVLVTRRDVCHDAPALCRAILSVYRDAIAFIRQHPDQAMRLYAEHAGVDPQYLDGTWDPLIYDLNLDWNVVTTLQQQFEWARRETTMGNASGGILPLLAPGPLRELLPGSVSIPDPAEGPAR